MLSLSPKLTVLFVRFLEHISSRNKAIFTILTFSLIISLHKRNTVFVSTAFIVNVNCTRILDSQWARGFNQTQNGVSGSFSLLCSFSFSYLSILLYSTCEWKEEKCPESEQESQDTCIK